MRNRILFYFFTLLTCLSKAQEPAAKVYNAKNGLQGSAFNEIIQGKGGNLWIASDQGITKYNGYFFKNFASDEGLFDEHIASIKSHKSGYVWAVSKKANLFKLQNDSVIPFENNRLLSRMVEHTAEVSSMAIDQGDTIWIGVKNADYYLKLVPLNGTYAIKKIKFETKALLKYANKQYFYSINNRGNNQDVFIEEEKNKFRFIFKSKINSLSYSNCNNQTVISCNEYVFKNDNSEPFKLNDNINQLHIDEENNIWLLFENLGFVKAKAGNLKDLNTLIGNVNFLSYFRDYEGGTWLGSFDKGLYYIPSFNVYSILQKDGLIDEMITSIYKDLNNRVIAGSSNGKLFIIEKYKARKILDLNLSKITQNQILNIFQSKDEYYWVSCLHSAFRISKDFKEVTELKHNGKRLQNIKQFVQGKNSTLWAGGENRLFSIQNSPEHITFTDYDIRFKINALATDKNFELWLGCNNGLWKFNERFFKYFGFNNHWLKGKITDLEFDQNHHLWVGTHNKGLVLINKNTIKHYSRSNGLLSNYIKQISFTNDGRVILATANGLNVFTDTKILSYNIKNGLYSNNCLGVINIENEIWTSTTKGISIVLNSVDEKIPPRLKTYLTKFSINQKNFFPPSSKAIILRPDQNNIEIEFAAVSFKNNSKTRYRYLLRGLNENWQSTTNPSIQFLKLNDGEYTLTIQAENYAGQWGEDTAQLSFKINAPLYKQWWFIIFSLTLIIITSSWFARWRLKKNHFKELRQAELKRRLIDLELQALRSQMNPHFIFNSINSIQHFVVNNNSTEAQRYLSKFAKLMRNVLDNSKTSHITLEKELQTLSLYLQLESLRFEEHFEYTIQVDEKIDTVNTEIPSMLIQPYLENAIWHGLMHKKGKGQIKIDISLLNDKQIKCLIEDDGIGREKAKEYRSVNKISYKSYGMMLAKERLNVLNKINDSSLSIEITDLKDENLNPTGTRVEIFVPIN